MDWACASPLRTLSRWTVFAGCSSRVGRLDRFAATQGERSGRIGFWKLDSYAIVKKYNLIQERLHRPVPRAVCIAARSQRYIQGCLFSLRAGPLLAKLAARALPGRSQPQRQRRAAPTPRLRTYLVQPERCRSPVGPCLDAVQKHLPYPGPLPALQSALPV